MIEHRSSYILFRKRFNGVTQLLTSMKGA
jgi:hypothetical protein